MAQLSLLIKGHRQKEVHGFFVVVFEMKKFTYRLAAAVEDQFDWVCLSVHLAVYKIEFMIKIKISVNGISK